MSNRSEHSRQRKRQSIRTSYIWAGIMAICALAALFVAIWVVMTVYEKIAGDSSEWATGSYEEETTELAIEKEDVYGWITDDSGSRYREEDGSFASDSWKIWEGGLYYLKDDGYMATEDMSKDGQVFFFGEDGALKDIQLDTGWKGQAGDDGAQDLDSLVKGPGFWSYLSSDTRYAGIFKPICYRYTTETKERFLGSEDDPEVSTRNSLQIHDGYLYYLPQVTTQALSSLSKEEQELCNKLFRIKPGDPQKEFLAEDVTGYLVLEDGKVYIASGGEIKEAPTGTFYPIGEEKYHIQVKDGACYLIDSMGEILTGDGTGVRSVGSRMYTLDKDGKIKDVRPSGQTYEDLTFTLGDDPQDSTKKAIYKEKKDGQKVVAAQARSGIDSFCIAEDKLYYSAVVDKGENGADHSQIFCMDPDGMYSKEISERFKGNIYRMYYYGGKGRIYGEYSPSSEKNCYGQIAVIDLDGNVHVIDDKASRGATGQDGDEWLSLLMVDGNTVTTFLQTCTYEEGGWPWRVSSERPYQFSDVLQDKIAGPSSVRTPEQTSGQTPPTQSPVGGPSVQPTTGGAPAQPTTGGSSAQPTTGGSSAQPSAGGSSAQPTTAPPSTRPSQSQPSTQPTTAQPATQPSTQAPVQAAPTQAAQPPAQAPGRNDSPAGPITVPPGDENRDVVPTIEPNPGSGISAGGGDTSEEVRFVGPDGSP